MKCRWVDEQDFRVDGVRSWVRYKRYLFVREDLSLRVVVEEFGFDGGLYEGLVDGSVEIESVKVYY